MTPWLAVVGLGEDGLDGLAPPARAAIAAAELVVGGRRHLALVGEHGARSLAWQRPLAATLEAIAAHEGRRVCVLASGDPMSYGIGVPLARRFGHEAMAVWPAPSAFSLACARLGWPVAETVQLSLHGRPLALLAAHLAPRARLLILSHDRHTPGQVAALLARAGFGESRLHVLCHMGGARERRFTFTAAAGPACEADDLNTLAVELVAAPGRRILPPVPGLPDDAFQHDGQLTRRELRAASLAALAPLPGALLWDVGAGCGSIAIEWMRAAPRAAAIAIERHRARREAMAANAAALGVPGLEIVAGEAPAALDGLAAPDAIFIGGGLARAGVAEACWQALPCGGRLVANAVTLESERRLAQLHGEKGGELVRFAIARAEPLAGFTVWRPALPVVQWRAVKP